MARMKIHVPAALVDPLYHELQMVWEMHTERIATGETGQLAPRPDAAQKLRAAKSQRHAVGELLDQVDWDSRRQDEPIDLVGSDTLLDELVRPLLSIFGEQINEACQAAVDRGESIEPLVEQEKRRHPGAPARPGRRDLTSRVTSTSWTRAPRRASRSPCAWADGARGRPAARLG